MTNLNPQTQYVQVSTNQIPLEHINLEYLSGVTVNEEAQCLLDISNNQNAIQSSAAAQQQQHAHPQPHQHQSLAAQHIQQFKIEYPTDGDYAEDEEVVSQGAVEVEAVHIEENSSINSYDGHNVTTIHPAGVAPSSATHHHAVPTSVDSKTLYTHQYNGVVTAATNTTASIVPQSLKRARHHEIQLKNGEQDFTDVISAAVDYFKMQTAVADADAAFAKYILEEVRQMSKKRKNEFKRKVTTWLTSEDDNGGLE